MSDALRGRIGRILAIVLVTAAASARHLSNLVEKPSLARSFEARVDDWTNDAFIYCGPDWGDDRGDEVVDWRASMECVSREDDDHCFRDMYRGQLEALEANSSYYEIQAVSPTGASFVKPTLVRASLESAY